jgi:SPP1 family predicted phage head-tail adaptor
VSARLKDKLQILKPVYTENGSGGQTVEYVEAGVLFASIKELDVSRANVRGKDVQMAKYEVVIRKREIEADRRLIWNGRVMEIDAVSDTGGPPFYQILSCREVKPV